MAKKIVVMAHTYGVSVLINDNVALCQASGADGVHLGEADMPIAEARSILGPDKIIGATAKSLERSLSAQAEGADYLGLGALFSTGTKTDVERMSFEVLRGLVRAVDIPVVAIGGLSLGNVSELRDTGVAGASFVSAIFGAEDSQVATIALREKLTNVLALKPVLSIAGSDNSGGAGIQADIKAMMANGVYAMTAITSLTAQNTQGVTAAQNAKPEFLAEQYGCAVLVKGGHGKNDASDVLYYKGNLQWFIGDRIDNVNTHGTGCTLSSAMAANLAKGYHLVDAIQLAKNYLTGAIADQLDLGQGSGPLNHGYRLVTMAMGLVIIKWNADL